jgi:outer membrane protein OmpA-like peptidoglycan-associated protein
MGIDAGRLTSKGFGESKPVNTNDTPEGKAANRRVEFVKS